MPIRKLFDNGATPNILIIITDQERAVSEWPESYRSTLAGQLKAMQKLEAHGLSFKQAFTAACMCSPSRATFQTSQYPIVTDCTTTGRSTLPSPTRFPNIATVLGSVQPTPYTSYWIGKWHLLSEEPGSQSTDLSQWGYQAYPSSGTAYAWDPPDAGWTLGPTYLGGGTQGPATTNQNDQRYVADAIRFLQNPPAGPWCLVVSLVNPHDVHLGYEAQDGTYYDSSLYQGLNVPLPTSVNQSLATMPRGQSYSTWNGQKSPGATTQDFANFYAYLMQYVDGQIGSILGAMSQTQIGETLIIRFADHGEMGLAHGLVEKFVNAYGQCLHVPLVFSNPVAWPQGESTDALASTLDLAPTLAGLLGVSSSFKQFTGADLSPVLDDPSKSVQDYVHFTYDDLAGSNGPSVIRTIRSKKWVYSVYLDSVTSAKSGYSDADWEMYDLSADPSETHNLAGKGLAEQTTLDKELQAQMVAKGTAPKWYPLHWPPQATANSRGGPPPSSDPRILPIERLPGITPLQARNLVYAGVPTTAELLARGESPEGRKRLASLAPADDALLEAWLIAARAPTPG